MKIGILCAFMVGMIGGTFYGYSLAWDELNQAWREANLEVGSNLACHPWVRP